MNCYVITDQQTPGAIETENQHGSPLFIRSEECREALFPERYRLRREDYWVCTACSDNGVDDKKMTDSRRESIVPGQLVLSKGRVIGYYLPDENAVIELGENRKIKFSEPEHTPGWGDVTTYTLLFFAEEENSPLRKEFELIGCMEVPPEVTEDAFLDQLVAFAEAKGWYFGGGVSEIRDGRYAVPGKRSRKQLSEKPFEETKPSLHRMKLQPKPFSLIKSGKKSIELRLYDEKRRRIRPGDRIEFTNTESGEALQARVLALHLFEDFEALYQSLPLSRCGYTEEEAESASASDMEQYYPPEEQRRHGAVGIELAVTGKESP